jgi:hypothetical protein
VNCGCSPFSVITERAPLQRIPIVNATVKIFPPPVTDGRFIPSGALET